jgi:digeranylgeranylglycerophospholipid reductase
VVGAGVAGLSAGFSASLNRAETLILERKEKIGVPVKCGELIPSKEEAERLFPHANSLKKFYAILPKKAVCNKIKEIRVLSPKNREYFFAFDGLVLRKEIFERAIAEEARKKGAAVQTSTTVEAVNKKGNVIKVLTRSQRGKAFLRSRLIIGADGFPSKLGERQSLKSYAKAVNVALCVQQVAYDAKVNEEMVDLCLSKKYAPGGYAWVIPKGDGVANVGVGIRLPYLKNKSSIIDYLKAFIRKHPIISKYFTKAKFKPMIAKILPVGGLTPQLYERGVLLAGDAAGTVLPVNGSGIPTALVSGYLAGLVVAENLQGKCQLSLYPDALQVEVGKVVKRAYLYRRIADIFMCSDWLLEKLLRIMGKSRVAKVIRCEPIKPLFN